MSTILIDALYEDEQRVALLDKDGMVTAFDFHVESKKKIKGNIYIAKVVRIEPALQAVFIDYEQDKSGFLSFSEICSSNYNVTKKEKDQLLKHDKFHEQIEDNDLRSKEILVFQEDKETKETKETKENVNNLKKYNVSNTIKIGQKILVQAIKEERGSKVPSFSTYINLVGRYAILMPNTPNRNGISKLITKNKDKENLQSILNSINMPQECSIVLTKQSTDMTKAKILEEINYLDNMWFRIFKKFKELNTEKIIYSDANLLKRVLRDLCNKSIKKIILDCSDSYWKKVEEYIDKVLLMYAPVNIMRHDQEVPIFAYYKVETQLFNLYSSSCILPSGGYIVINPTEALIAIDVNSGKMTHKSDVENTAYKTNIEAANEVAKQVRLRNLAGIIVIDFIDMEDRKNRKKVENIFKKCFVDDIARTQFGVISKFGMLEMSRQRMGLSFVDLYTTSCNSCKGLGNVRSISATVSAIFRALQNDINKSKDNLFTVFADQDVMEYICNDLQNKINILSQEHNISIYIKIDNTMLRGQFRIVSSIKFLKESEKKDEIIEFEENTTDTRCDLVKNTKVPKDKKKKNTKKNIDYKNIKNHKVSKETMEIKDNSKIGILGKFLSRIFSNK